MNNKLFAAVILAVFSVAPIAGITASEAGQAAIDQRFGFVFTPAPNEFGTWSTDFDDGAGNGALLQPWASEIWFAINRSLTNAPNEGDGAGLTWNRSSALVKVLGDDDRARHAPDLWSDGADAFDNTAVPTDSVTFNPALILHTDADYVTRFAEDDEQLDWIRACSQDSNLKKHLRFWYEANHDLHGPRVLAGNYDPATVADVVQIESTYYLVDAASFNPNLACAGSSQFPFPTEGLYTNIDECDEEYGSLAPGGGTQYKQPGLDTLRPVKLVLVEGSGTAGTIRLEYEWTIDTDDDDQALGVNFDCLQFFDHMVHIDNTVIGADAQNLQLRGEIWYLGNTRPDSPKDVTFTGDIVFWDRDNNPFPDAVHNGANGETRTFYTKVESFPRTTLTDSVDGVVIRVGKEFSQGDIFYVDGVRYEIPSIHVVSNNFASITLRTPLPKSAPCHPDDRGELVTPQRGIDGQEQCESAGDLGDFNEMWTSVPGDQVDDLHRVIVRDGTWQDEDFSVVTTQWIVEYDAADPLPLDPPFNRPFYRQVDDTDVQLWECDPSDVFRDGLGDEDDCSFFPYGEISLSDNFNGLPRWPEGERYLTMEEPPQEWIDYWAAEETDFWDIRDRFPADDVDPELISSWNCSEGCYFLPIYGFVPLGIESGINPSAVGLETFDVFTWYDCGVTWSGSPTCVNYDLVNFTWIVEWYEGRYSTNLHEIPNFAGQRTFDKYELTQPDRFTIFLLPNRTNFASYMTVHFEDYVGPIWVLKNLATLDPVIGASGDDYNVTLLSGDYLFTSGLFLQNGQTRHAFTIVPDGNFTQLQTVDPYVIPFHSLFAAGLLFPQLLVDDFHGEDPFLLNVYGSDDRADHAPDLWDDGEDAFNPASIPLDSVTFNPALILHTDSDYVTRFAEADEQLDWIRACSQDSNLKKHLRIWYEPNHDLHGPRVLAGNYDPATVADVVLVESSYYLIDAASFNPNLACAGSSQFPFPTEGLYTNIDECDEEYGDLSFEFGQQYKQPGLDTLRPVKLVLVEGSGTAGTIRLEYEWTIDTDDEDLDPGQGAQDPGVNFDCLQFFDHMVHIDNTVIGADAQNLQLRGEIWYLGNTRPDSPKDVTFTGDVVFWDRDNNPFPDAVHNGANGETRTFYTKVESFPRTTTSDSVDGVVIRVGKEFSQGDIFYVDGVRYEIPSIHVVSNNFASITLRTPLPKSAPCDRLRDQASFAIPDALDFVEGTVLSDYFGTGICEGAGQLQWTSVPGDQVDDLHRVIVRDGTWQDEDFSVVTTQWIVEYNTTDPFPLDPPFNRPFYRQVDDTDVQLWECDPSDVFRDGLGDEDDCRFFPYGETSLSDNYNGLPRWPEGERYLTMMSPPQEWIDYWAAEQTDFWDIRDRFPDDDVDPELSSSWGSACPGAPGIGGPAGPDCYIVNTVGVAGPWLVPLGIETGINPSAFHVLTGGLYTWCNNDAWSGSPTCVQPNLVNFTYIEEWYEGRYTTNLLQVPNFEGSRSYGSHEIVSTPDRYTTFLLPNRTNLASNLSAEFEDISGDDNTDAQGAIGPGPLAGDDDVRLLGGDYLVMTSFRHTSGAPQPTTTTTTTEPSPTTTTPTTPPTTTQPTTTTGGGGQQTPGFELVALLAALGAAFVLVRRRL